MKKHTTAAVLWTAVALLAVLIPIRPLVGEGLPFTAFEFIGPLGGALFGAASGAIAAIGAKGIGALIAGGALTAFGLTRLLTPGAAAVYMDGRQRWILLVAIAAMIAFWLHPVGRQVWFIALYWLIPLAAWPLRTNLLARSLGATFTAHALGGALFIWLVPTTPALWIGLVPVIAIERLVFGAGMTVALIAFEAVLSKLPVQVQSLLPIRIGTQLRSVEA